jgi:hypothetical protein
VASGLFDQGPELRVGVLPELGESGVVLPGLLPFALSFVDLRQTEVGRSSAVEEMVGNVPVSLESFTIAPQGIE